MLRLDGPISCAEKLVRCGKWKQHWYHEEGGGCGGFLFCPLTLCSDKMYFKGESLSCDLLVRNNILQKHWNISLHDKTFLSN